MNASFFYNLTLSQFELTLASYRNNSNNIDNLNKTIFTIYALLIGFCYFLYENELVSPIQLNVISLFFLTLSLVLGFYANRPKAIDYLNPLEIYNQYYELKLSDEKFEESVAEITVTMAEDVQNIRKLCNMKASLFFGMQILVSIGLLFLLLSVIDFLKILN